MELKSQKVSGIAAWVAIVLPVICLSILGLIILTSAGAGGSDPYGIVRKQALWLVIAVFAFFFTTFISSAVLHLNIIGWFNCWFIICLMRKRMQLEGIITQKYVDEFYLNSNVYL